MKGAHSLGEFRLPVYGPARLLRGEEQLRARRKGLALLYYLALEGPTTRDKLAELLWGRPGARANLRTELHHLQRCCGLAFPPGQDPLRLPENVHLDLSGHAEPLEGLEGLTPELDAWLTEQRFELETRTPAPSAAHLGAEGWADLPEPGLWIFDAPVGSDAAGLVRDLARERGLPLFTRWQPGAKGLLLLEPPYGEHPPAETLCRWPGVLAVLRPPFGEEPALILELRALCPAERSRYLQLPPVRFAAARRDLLADLPLETALRRYLDAQGRWGLLTEEVRSGHPLPLRFRARYRSEARRLPREVRLALERLSVCRGPVTGALLEALGAEEAVEELERRRWLVYRGGWRFADTVARRALLFDLPPGLRSRYHQLAAAALASDGRLLEAAWQRSQAGGGRFEPPQESLNGYARALFGGLDPATPPRRRSGKGSALPLLVRRGSSRGLEAEGHGWWMLRPEGIDAPSRLEWEALETEALVQIEGELFVFAPAMGALDGVPPLEGRAGPLRFAFAPVRSPVQDERGAWIWPANGRFSCTLRLPAGWPLELESRAEEVALRLQVTAYAARAGGEVDAVDLSSAARARGPGTLRAS